MKSKKIVFRIFLLLLPCAMLRAQDLKYYRYDADLLSKEFHKGRREALREKMPENSVAVFFANPERNRANDVDFKYHQDPNFYYLTGFKEPNSVLLIFTSPQPLEHSGRPGTNGAISPVSNEFLFVPERNAFQETWTGRRAGPPGAAKITGITAFANTSFDSIGFSMSREFLYILPQGVAESKQKDNLYRFIQSFREKCKCGLPDSEGEKKLSRIMTELREIKQPEEIQLMRKAVTMSCEGHNEIMRAIKPGMYEYDVQAVGEYVFARHGSEYEGYGSICGGGENTCILHYTSNRRPLKSGDLQLNDMGAEYHGYTADVTRTIPVNGKFSPEQKIIYELVLKATDAGIEAAKPGNAFRAPHNAAMEVISKGLLDLGITKDSASYRIYFMHSTSHYLGLDVHDPGSRGPLKPGMLITVEPGIYIPENSDCDKKWWNIGVRIEDDILITENGYENLSASSPRTVEEIEKMMKREPVYVK